MKRPTTCGVGRYDPESIPALVHVLCGLLSGKRRSGVPAFALICTTLRQESTLKAFITASVEAGLQVRSFSLIGFTEHNVKLKYNVSRYRLVSTQKSAQLSLPSFTEHV